MDKLTQAIKKAKSLPEDVSSAKMEVLKALKEHTSGLMADKLGKSGKLSKVVVEGDSPESIEEGLNVAKKAVKKMPLLADSEEEGHVCPMCKKEPCECDAEGEGHELAESSDVEEGEDAGLIAEGEETPEAIDAKIQELMKKKEALKSKFA